MKTHNPEENKILQASKKVSEHLNIDLDQFIEFGTTHQSEELHGDSFYRWVN
jgi:hypothetical protein